MHNHAQIVLGFNQKIGEMPKGEFPKKLRVRWRLTSGKDKEVFWEKNEWISPRDKTALGRPILG